MSQPPGYPVPPSDPYAQPPSDPYQPVNPAPAGTGGANVGAGDPASTSPAPAPGPQYSVPGPAPSSYGPPPSDSYPAAASPFGPPIQPPDAPQHGLPPGYPPQDFGQPGYGPPQSAPPAYGPPQSAPPAYGPPQSAPPGLGPTAPFPPAGFGQPGFAPGGPGAPGQGRNRGLLIASIVLAVVLVVAGGGTALFLTFGRSEGKGLASPEQTVDRFLTAVYKTRSEATAEQLVCGSARDSKVIRKRISDLRRFDQNYKSPAYSWTEPTVESRTDESAKVRVTVKLTTSDDKVSEHSLRILTVKGDGWLVCEISNAS